MLARATYAAAYPVAVCRANDARMHTDVLKVAFVKRVPHMVAVGIHAVDFLHNVRPCALVSKPKAVGPSATYSCDHQWL